MKNPKSFTKAILVIILLFCVAASAGAMTKKEMADQFYDEASKLYESGNCDNASQDAEYAQNLYSQDGDQEDVSKVLDLIGKIGDCIKKNADKKYDEANKYFLAGKYDDAIKWADLAKDEYSHVPGDGGTNGAANCDTLIKESELKIKQQKIDSANADYQKAYSLYESEDYDNAKKLGAEALDLFNQTDYQQGIDLCDALFTEINSKIVDIQNIADEELRMATDQYKDAEDKGSFDEYLEAGTKAQSAQDNYKKIGYMQGYSDAQEVINLANQQIGKMEDVAKQVAAGYVLDGKNQLLLGRGSREEADKRAHFDSAEKNFTAALAIYSKLEKWAFQKADNVKADAYKALIADCNARLAEIKTEKDNIATRNKADQQFIAAQSFFTKGQCKNASKYVGDAKSLFQKIKDQVGVLKCETLSSQINDCVTQMKDAESDLNNTSKYYKIADYTNASAELDKALKIYTDIKNEDGMTTCNNFKKKIADSMGNKKKADQLMVQAQADFNNLQYEASINNANDAKTIYTSINFLEGISKSNALIKSSQERIDLNKAEGQRNIMITIGAIIGAIILVMIVWGARKVQKQKADKQKAQEERRRVAEEMMRKRNEDMLMDELRAKEMELERQKLKAMIDAEMKKSEALKR